MSKRNYWLKLREDYFNSPKIKKLRSVAGGDTYALIYLEMQCYSIKTEGIIKFEGLEDNLAKELALILNEDEQNVAFLLSYLTKYKLIECISDDKFLLPEAMQSIGSESDVTARVRRYRERKKQQIENQKVKALQCNTDVTLCNNSETQEKQKVTNCNDIKIREDIDIDNRNVTTLHDVFDFIEKHQLLFVDGKEFFNYYQQRNWHTKEGRPISNWQAVLLVWEDKARERLMAGNRTQQQTNRRNGYIPDINGTPQPQPLQEPSTNSNSVESFYKTLSENGKSSHILNTMVGNLSNQKEMK